MNWTLLPDRPIYQQLIEQIQLRIITSVYKPGDKLPSVRELAQEAEVNPNTMQRALADLEKSEIIITQRTSGRFITDNLELINNIKNLIADEKIQSFFESMQQIGYNKNQAASLLNKKIEGEIA